MEEFLEDTLSQMLAKMDTADFTKLSQFIVNYYFEKSDKASSQQRILESNISTPMTVSNHKQSMFNEEEWIGTHFDAENENLSDTTVPKNEAGVPETVLNQQVLVKYEEPIMTK